MALKFFKLSKIFLCKSTRHFREKISKQNYETIFEIFLCLYNANDFQWEKSLRSFRKSLQKMVFFNHAVLTQIELTVMVCPHFPEGGNMKALLLSTLLASVSYATVCPPGGGQNTCSDSANLTISGVVTAVCNIEVAAEPAATALNVSGGENGTKIATVTEESNNLAGYRVFVSSANNGSLVHASLPGQSFPYQISYDGGPLVTPTTAQVEVKNSGALPGFVSTTSDVNITFAANPGLATGTYSDTLTFELESI